MNVFTHNFNPTSNSGPNKFCRQLFEAMIRDHGIKIVSNQTDADIEFALIQLQSMNIKPLVMRLDGIYFNSEQDYDTQNRPIKATHDRSHTVIYQSNFNQKLTEKWFGPHPNGIVIHNATDKKLIDAVDELKFQSDIPDDTKVWSCASSWRPHKRLEENLRYFLEKAPPTSVMIVAGQNADNAVIEKYQKKSNNRVFYVGEIDYKTLLSLYKRSSTFIHLAYLDHCPNVVVDAQSAGCHVVCSSTGGTAEIVTDGTIICEDEWDFEPIKLYDPPKIDFVNYYLVKRDESNSLKETARLYYDAFVSAANSELQSI